MKLNFLLINFRNILAEGLSEGEFMTPLGDPAELQWSQSLGLGRGTKVANVVTQMMEICDIVATVENDHPSWILNKIREKCKDTEGKPREIQT
jgi:hypothetical protein